MMLNGKTPSAEIAMDAEVRGWLESTSGEVRDVIVEAALPPRRVVFQQRPGTAPIPKSIDSSSDSDRETLLNKLDQTLREMGGVQKTRVLKAAGAIVVRASAKEIQVIAQQPMVKAIRANRRFA